MALLQTEGLTVSFGGVHALSGVDVTIDGGGIVGLIGPNGAGETTFIDAMAGVVPPSSGKVVFREEDITDAPPFKRTNRGLVRTFQTLELYEDLTVAPRRSSGSTMARRATSLR